jgi:hypothetical protein
LIDQLFLSPSLSEDAHFFFSPCQVQQEFVELLQSERLEIVTGGWVMTDEANAHYANMLEQLIFGKNEGKNAV